MVKASRLSGLTLIEVLVTLTLFGIVLTLTLYFYSLSIKLNKRHDQGSEVYRRANKIMNDIERFVHSGLLVYANENNLAVLPFRPLTIVNKQGLFNPTQEAQVLSILEQSVSIYEGENKNSFAVLKDKDKLNFEPQSFSDQEAMRRYDFVTIYYSSTPASPTREDRTYKFRRQVLLDRY